MAEILSGISLGTYIASGLLFVLAVLFWFLFRIPTVIGDLSGRNAKKSIAAMRAYNEKQGIKDRKERPISGALRKRDEELSAQGGKTDDITADMEPMRVGETESMSMYADRAGEAVGSTETMSIIEQANRQPAKASNAVTGSEPIKYVKMVVSAQQSQETELLVTAETAPKRVAKGVPLIMLDEVLITHTEEELV